MANCCDTKNDVPTSGGSCCGGDPKDKKLKTQLWIIAILSLIFIIGVVSFAQDAKAKAPAICFN